MYHQNFEIITTNTAIKIYANNGINDTITVKIKTYLYIYYIYLSIYLSFSLSLSIYIYIYIYNNGIVEEFSITLLDKTDGSDPTRREEYCRRVLKTVTPYGLNIID